MGRSTAEEEKMGKTRPKRLCGVAFLAVVMPVCLCRWWWWWCRERFCVSLYVFQAASKAPHHVHTLVLLLLVLLGDHPPRGGLDEISSSVVLVRT